MMMAVVLSVSVEDGFCHHLCHLPEKKANVCLPG